MQAVDRAGRTGEGFSEFAKEGFSLKTKAMVGIYSIIAAVAIYSYNSYTTEQSVHASLSPSEKAQMVKLPSAAREVQSLSNLAPMSLPRDLIANASAQIRVSSETDHEGFHRGDVRTLENLFTYADRAKNGTGYFLPDRVSWEDVGMPPGTDLPVKQEARDGILNAAAKTELYSSWLYAVISSECSFDPRDADTSSATGYTQLINKTAIDTVGELGADYGYKKLAAGLTYDEAQKGYVTDSPRLKQTILNLRHNAKDAILLGAAVLKDDKDYHENRLGRELDLAETYLAYFLGRGSAAIVLPHIHQNPNALVTSVDALLGEKGPIESNRSIFLHEDGSPRTFRELKEKMADKVYPRLFFYAINERDNLGPNADQQVAEALKIGYEMGYIDEAARHQELAVYKSPRPPVRGSGG
jgi:hypothetical protein